MSDRNNDICREGIVKEYADGRARVLITAQSACASCHAKGACGNLETAQKEIDAFSEGPLQPGDRVRITISTKVGMTAVLYGFVLPLIVLAFVFFGAVANGVEESIAGVAGLGALVPFYLLLWLLRGRLFRSFIFTVNKIINSDQEVSRG